MIQVSHCKSNLSKLVRDKAVLESKPESSREDWKASRASISKRLEACRDYFLLYIDKQYSCRLFVFRKWKLTGLSIAHTFEISSTETMNLESRESSDASMIASDADARRSKRKRRFKLSIDHEFEAALELRQTNVSIV